MRAVALSAALAAPCCGMDFLSIGDWGDSGAKELAPLMGKYSPEFVLAIGDNFYDKGVSGVDDSQFKTKFEDTFTASSLQVPWYIAAGNHDYYGGTKGINAEMEYSSKSSRWIYPSLYYTRDAKGSDGVTVAVFSVDTWRLNGGDTFVVWDSVSNKGKIRSEELVHKHVREGRISETTRDLIFSSFPTDDDTVQVRGSGDDAQLKWLDAALANSTADWKVVMGHFPIHSCTTGEHGDTPSLIKYLQPILEKHNVTAYFSGHDHILQHIQENGVNYLGSGAGARKHSGINSKYSGLKGTVTGKYGFMMHSATKTTLKTTFVDEDGNHPYSFTITK
eukprot:TRINITY_DN16_c0_g1_i1.p2 TRINITY_DN16_c0_g1~~TRINITY_DN16_c0_g1_i1.p2  ORF type:complete len:334 (+),score=96.25 TRINITY_DN16_c0_g1_i1:103-1104(+)